MVTKNNYIFGYKKLADFGAKQLSSKGACHYDDTLRLPTLFLYRHYLELQLKSLYSMFVTYHPNAVSIDHKVGNSHNIKKIWGKLTELFEELLKQTDAEKDDYTLDIFEAVNNVVDQFNQYDENSQFFRYDLDKQKQAHNSLGFTVDYEKLSSCIDQADDAFFALEKIIHSE